MSVGFLLMLGVTACYTISSLSDKYAAAKVKLTPNEFTFLMCSSMSVMLLFTLPFQEIRFDLSLFAFGGVLLTAVCKLLEFKMCTAVLKKISAFELKAWLGVTLFLSYFTDIIMGQAISAAKLICLCLTAGGLVLIVHSEKKEKIDYKSIALPLILYLGAKYGYGLVIKSFSPHASSIMLLLPALVTVSLVTLPSVKLSAYREKHGTGYIILARIPNTIGMIMENAVIGISLASYSLIQPLILVSLFFIGLIRREYASKLNIIGGIICMIGAVGFQAAGIFK
ncbi:MAG: hypothetical protein IKP75_06525 [Oscillospiraceae bacterium]|nr:hypothetical protein [Oscillospiraceae bacterium]